MTLSITFISVTSCKLSQQHLSLTVLQLDFNVLKQVFSWLRPNLVCKISTLNYQGQHFQYYMFYAPAMCRIVLKSDMSSQNIGQIKYVITKPPNTCAVLDMVQNFEKFLPQRYSMIHSGRLTVSLGLENLDIEVAQVYQVNQFKNQLKTSQGIIDSTTVFFRGNILRSNFLVMGHKQRTENAIKTELSLI